MLLLRRACHLTDAVVFIFQKVIPFPDQILQFGQTMLQIDQYLPSASVDWAKLLCFKSLFLINIGGNDLGTYLFSQSAPLDDFIDGLLVILKDAVEVRF